MNPFVFPNLESCILNHIVGGCPQASLRSYNPFRMLTYILIYKSKGRSYKQTMSHTKGFTLIELIIVIGLIALLATTVILVINPVKIFQEARDSQRIADLGQMNSAMSLMLATSSAQPVLGPDPANCYVYKIGQNCTTRYVSAATSTASATPSQLVNGTGWVPVNLGPGGATPAISAWPIDPKNDTTSLFYSYAYDAANSWEFTAKMESARYKQTGSDDVESTDGGNKPALFEVGTNVNL